MPSKNGHVAMRTPIFGDFREELIITCLDTCEPQAVTMSLGLTKLPDGLFPYWFCGNAGTGLAVVVFAMDFCLRQARR